MVPILALALFGVQTQIEKDLTDRATATLQKRGLPWASVKFRGRDASLEGLSFSRAERDAALRQIRSVWGIRNVTDNSELIASPETYSWWASRNAQKIKIRGHVPNKDDRRSILGFVKAAIPDLQVDDQMLLAGGSPPRQAWLGSISYALLQLGQLKVGKVQLSGMDLSISGEALSSDAYRTLKGSIPAQLPEGITLNTNDVKPPVVKPYAWRVKFTGKVIAVEGHVPSEAIHSQLLVRIRNLFPGIKLDDSMDLASGAPEGWFWAVSTSLTQLHRLESGRVKLKDTVLEFEGVAPDKGTAKDVASSIINGLPSSYRSFEKVTVREQPSPGAPSPAKPING